MQTELLCANELSKYKNNIKKTSNILKTLTGIQNDKSGISDSFKIDNKFRKYLNKIANKFCEYFSEIGKMFTSSKLHRKSSTIYVYVTNKRRNDISDYNITKA